jgi:hypothetical protein
MGREKSPALFFLLIPLGMLGGALLSLLLGYALSVGGAPAAPRQPGDPNDGPAMLGVFLMFAGAAAGTLVGIVLAVLLYLKKRQQPKLE